MGTITTLRGGAGQQERELCGRLGCVVENQEILSVDSVWSVVWETIAGRHVDNYYYYSTIVVVTVQLIPPAPVYHLLYHYSGNKNNIVGGWGYGGTSK